MKKIISSALALCLCLSCAATVTACAKKEQANTLEFSGVYQAANGDVLLQIDNISDYDKNVYLECTLDGGNTWQQAVNIIRGSLRTAIAKEYAEDFIDKTLSIGVRLGEEGNLAASAWSQFIDYKVKPVSEVTEIFCSIGDDSTDGFTEGKGKGTTAFKLCKKADRSFAVEKFDYVENPENDFAYDYTFVQDNWDKSAIKFEYKFVTFDQAFEDVVYLYHTGLKEETDTFPTDGWIDYNPATGITQHDYTSHLENNPLNSVGYKYEIFTVLIRAKATDGNLFSPCTPVCVIAEATEIE